MVLEKDGAIIGVDDPDAIMLQVAGSLKDSIAPDIMPFVNIKNCGKLTEKRSLKLILQQERIVHIIFGKKV